VGYRDSLAGHPAPSLQLPAAVIKRFGLRVNCEPVFFEKYHDHASRWEQTKNQIVSAIMAELERRTR
jgi:hypothetical protein